MKKSTFTTDYQCFLKLLRATRKASGLTQKQLADRMGLTQTQISKCEQGERRMDIIELCWLCDVVGVSPQEFVAQLQRARTGSER